MFAGGFTPTPELAAAVRAHAQAVKDALAAWHAGYDYYNFEETPPRPARCSRPPPITACRRSRPATTPTRRSSPPTPSGLSGSDMSTSQAVRTGRATSRLPRSARASGDRRATE